MDSKERLIKNIIMKLSNFVPIQLMTIVENTLTTEFNDFEIKETCRDVSIRYTESEGLLREFIAIKKIEGLSDKSLKRYADINMKALNYIGKPIKMITTNDLRYYLAVRQKAGNSAVSLDGVRRCMSTFYNWLVVEGYLDHSPCLNLKQIKCEKKIKQPLSDNELSIIRKSCKSDRDKALVEFMYSTGMRVSEIAECSIKDLNLESKECIVRHGKGNKQRYTYLSDECIDKLKKYIDDKGYSSTRHDTLFELSKNGIENVINKLGRKNGLHLYPHKFRRSCACTLLYNGMDVYNVSRVLGHSSLSTTSIYLAMNNQKIKDEFQKCMN